MFVSETYALQDCYVYNDCTTSSIESVFTVPSSVKNSTYDISSSGWKFGNLNGWTDIPFSLTQPTISFELDFKIIENNANGITLNIGKVGNNWRYFDTNGSNLRYGGSNIGTITSGAEIKIKVYSNKIEIYNENTLLHTDNSALTSINLGLGSGANRYVRIKDFKIRPL